MKSTEKLKAFITGLQFLCQADSQHDYKAEIHKIMAQASEILPELDKVTDIREYHLITSPELIEVTQDSLSDWDNEAIKDVLAEETIEVKTWSNNEPLGNLLSELMHNYATSQSGYSFLSKEEADRIEELNNETDDEISESILNQ